jgi:hypothetical protein
LLSLLPKKWIIPNSAAGFSKKACNSLNLQAF